MYLMKLKYVRFVNKANKQGCHSKIIKHGELPKSFNSYTLMFVVP